MEIKHNNIFYVADISEIGGVETFVYEMVKKFKDLDIAVVYKTGHPEQIKRIKKYCNAYQFKNQDIICKVAIINYDVSIIDYIKEGKVYQVIHGDYENAAYSWKPPTDKRVTAYIGITKHIVESFKRITGNQNVILGYNPLTIEEEKPLITLVSATRLSPIKGKERMIKLANALDNAGINYIWYVFTNDTKAIQNSSIVCMKPRLDIGKWISQATYLVQLSDTEACSYAINEALYRNVPVIVTKLPYLEEIGVKDGINSYLMDFDCSNIDYIVKNINNVPKFKFKHLEDSYSNILAKGKSHYQEDMKKIVKIQCIKPYFDIQLQQGKKITDDPWKVTYERALNLIEVGVAKLV